MYLFVILVRFLLVVTVIVHTWSFVCVYTQQLVNYIIFTRRHDSATPCSCPAAHTSYAQFA